MANDRDFITCEELQFLAKAFDFGQGMFELLKAENICSLDDLRKKKQRLFALASRAKDFQKGKQFQLLVNIVDYCDRIFQVAGHITPIDKDVFLIEEFDVFVENKDKRANKVVEEFCFGNGPKPKHMDDENIRKHIKKLYVSEAIDQITERCREQLTACEFPIEQFCHDILSSRLDGTKHMIIEGRTQVGKSNVKCLIQASAGVSGLGVVILTKGRSERDELCDKITSNVEAQHLVINGKNCRKYQGIAQMLKGGGTIVGMQTAAQIQKITNGVKKCQLENPDFRFVIVLDEGDAMFRSRETEDARVQAEVEYRKLFACGPLVTVMISATVLPILLNIVDKSGSDMATLKTYQLKPNKDYVSVEMMHPLKSPLGESLYLDETLRYNHNSHDSLNLGTGPIPFTDAHGIVKQMYDAALGMNNSADAEDSFEVSKGGIYGAEPLAKRIKVEKSRPLGVLLLDITCNRVYAEGNVFKKAQLVQDAYQQKGQKMVAIVIVARGIYTRLGGRWVDEDKDKQISEVIQWVDEHEYYGLETPIFIFGFSKMTRGISFRSSLRVPTHLIVSRGQGYSVEDVIQTIGRATCNGKRVLESNGHAHVKLLATYSDFKVAKMYYAMIDFIFRRLREGDVLLETLQGAKARFPDAANIFRITDRKIGLGVKARTPAKMIIADLGLFNQEDAFEDPVDLDEDYANQFSNPETQKLLGVIHRLWISKPAPFELDDLRDAYSNDLHKSMSTANVKGLLRFLCGKGLLDSTTKEYRTYVWAVTNVRALKLLLLPGLSDHS